MKRKIIAVMLTAAMGVSMLAGCGSGNSGAASTSGSDGAENSDTVASSDTASDSADNSGGSGGGEKLTVICVGTEADTYITGYNKIAEDFSANNEYGVTVEFEYYENEQFKTKLTTLMASNAVPDIFFTWELSYLQPFVEGGKVADITSYLDADPEWKDSFAGGTLDKLAYDGKNYGIPTQKSLCVMFYNKQIFQDNGVEVPTTYDEFLQVCETLKSNGVTPMAMCGTDAWIPAQFVQQIAGGMAGQELFDAICDGTEQWNNETHVKAAEEVKKMADAGYFQDGFIGMGPEESTDLFAKGKTAMYFMGAWDCDRVQKDEIGENAGAFVLPAFDPQYNNISVGSVDTSFALAETCKNKDAAIAFLKYWTSQECADMLLYDYGRIPACNYEIDSSKLTPLVSEVVTISNEQVGLTPWWDRQFGAGEGVEFNNTCVSVIGGEDAQTAFDALQQFAEDNADR